MVFIRYNACLILLKFHLLTPQLLGAKRASPPPQCFLLFYSIRIEMYYIKNILFWYWCRYCLYICCFSTCFSLFLARHIFRQHRSVQLSESFKGPYPNTCGQIQTSNMFIIWHGYLNNSSTTLYCCSMGLYKKRKKKNSKKQNRSWRKSKFQYLSVAIDFIIIAYLWW